MKRCVRMVRHDARPLREGFGMEKRVLLVEDNAEFRQVFAHALGLALAAEQLDFTFVESGSMAEARARLQEGGLDAALIDVTLPDGNGLDLVREIKDGAPDRHPDARVDGGTGPLRGRPRR